MRLFKELTRSARGILSRSKLTITKPEFRRLIIEQFEDRRVLAVALDDAFIVTNDTPRVVSAPFGISRALATPFTPG
jgi:hypothetical protein